MNTKTEGLKPSHGVSPMSPATLVEDLKAAALYFEMNGGIVKETTLEWKAAATIEALAAERDAIEATIYGRHEKGFVMSPLIDPPSLPDAVRAIKEERDAALRLYGLGDMDAEAENHALTVRAETAEASLADAVKALEQVTNSRDIEAQPLRGAELRSEEC